MSVTVNTFIEDCKKDLSGQRHIFPRNMAMYKNMVFAQDEILEADKTSTHKLKKAMKTLQTAAQGNVQNEVTYAESMEKLGSVALSREAETGIGTAFLKLSVITKELANHRKILCENFNNMVLFPINSLLKGDMNKIGDMKRPVDDAWKEYKSKGIKKEQRKKTSEIILYRIDQPEQTAEGSERERRTFMYHTSEYLSKANDIKMKKGVELVQHLIEHYHAQLRYFNSGIKLLEGMRSYFEGLADELQKRKLEKEEEKKELSDIKSNLKTILQLDSKEVDKSSGRQNYKIHGQQGDKVFGGSKSGHLHKRSEGVRKQWQKRYCVISNGLFTLAHNQQSAPTATLPLLTCQVKPMAEKDKKLQFALVAHNRTYLFQAEDEADYEAWISVLSNAREEALNKAFGEGEDALSKEPVSSIQELTQGIISEVRRLPGNNQCIDCNAYDPTWLSTNLGVVVCIECSGIHRELGVHVSRIRSLTLDRLGTAELLLARAVGNSDFNEIMEASLDPSLKPTAGSNMDQRKEFITQKYVQKAFINPSGHQPNILIEDLQRAINHHDILAVLQLYADGVDFNSSLPDSNLNDTSLHYCVEKEDLTSLHIVDFITQNCKNVNAMNTEGNTALHIAAMHDKPECTKLLVRYGANLQALNRQGKSALEIAKHNKFTEIIELLSDDGKTGKFDHVKIDWGLHETEDIYATPLDLINTSDRPEDPPKDYDQKVKSTPVAQDTTISPSVKQPLPQHGGLATQGPIQRSMTSPKSRSTVNTPVVSTTTDITTLTTANTSSQQARHSIALPHNYQVLPSAGQTDGKFPPPLPPSRRPTTKQKGPVPPPKPDTASKPTDVNATTSSTGPTVAIINTTSSGVTQPKETMTNLTASSVPLSLSTFTAKQSASAAANKNNPSTQPHPTLVDKSSLPPAPPTRSSSFLPRGSTEEMLPRPDRPPPPVPSVGAGHNRNRSEGGMLFNQQDFLDDIAAATRNRTNSLVTPKPGAIEFPIPLDPDAPPLPPPRPKNNEPPSPNNHMQVPASPPATSHTPLRSSSISRKEPKTKFRRAKALYDCEADHSDELTFVEGEIIIMKGEADPDWWFGEIEGDPTRRGVFPISFVHVLND
eukprot:TCONS_00016475-protein